MNNLETLAEDPRELLKNVALKVRTMDTNKLKRYVSQYGNAKAKKILTPLLESPAKQYSS